MCPKCNGYEFIIESLLIENSKSVKIVQRCKNCDYIVKSVIDDNLSETDDLFYKLEDTKPSDWKVVSMKNGY